MLGSEAMQQTVATIHKPVSGGSGEAAAFLARIDGILPLLKERSAEAERLRRLPDVNIRAMTDAGIFRAIQPKQWGGLGIDPTTWFESVVRVGSACASTAWIHGVVGGHAWYTGLLSQEAQQDVWGENRDARIASSYAPTGKAERVSNGFRLTGRWSFASGVDHCEWIVLGGVIPDNGEGPEYRCFLVPARDFKIDQDSWHVEGLQGSGSKDVTTDCVVPEYRTHTVDEAYAETEPGRTINSGPLSRMPWLSMFAYAVGSPAIGAAAGALESFIEEQQKRVSGFSGAKAADNPVLNIRLAEAMTLVNDARARIPRTWGDFYAKALAGEEIPTISRARCRYEGSYAMATCLNAVLKIFEIGGGGVLNSEKRFQRHLRDLMGMRNHPFAIPESWAGTYTKHLLGLPPMPFNRSSMACVR
jgi:3-hydroxy-9,10-secoandrosta-1,3,5(10)-triene-9,17-dione monooxygenase